MIDYELVKFNKALLEIFVILVKIFKFGQKYPNIEVLKKNI